MNSTYRNGTANGVVDINFASILNFLGVGMITLILVPRDERVKFLNTSESIVKSTFVAERGAETDFMLWSTILVSKCVVLYLQYNTL